MAITVEKINDRLVQYTLVSKELTVKIINLGATITHVIYNKDHMDVVLGQPCLDDYPNEDAYFGATIGRFANRIRKGHFRLDGKAYQLAINNVPNALHGGPKGFHAQYFEGAVEGDTLHLSYVSKDGEEGYPGNLQFKVSFTLIDDTLDVEYQAICDADTIVNFTNHSYFALQGQGNGDVTEQVMTSTASRYGIGDQDRLVAGELADVKGTPFDFLTAKTIGQDIDADDKQIQYCDGYDHYFDFNDSDIKTVTVFDPTTKHKLTVTTDLTGYHFYVPAYETPVLGKDGASYIGHCAFCIETSFMPDNINLQEQPDSLLKANETFYSKTTFTFS